MRYPPLSAVTNGDFAFWRECETLRAESHTLSRRGSNLTKPKIAALDVEYGSPSPVTKLGRAEPIGSPPLLPPSRLSHGRSAGAKYRRVCQSALTARDPVKPSMIQATQTGLQCKALPRKALRTSAKTISAVT
jgi:hypothetical protein